MRRAEDAAPPVDVAEIERLIVERREARQRREFARADAIRQDLAARGILLEDSPTGTRWKRELAPSWRRRPRVDGRRSGDHIVAAQDRH